jgi:hypothetical protein
MHIVDPIFGRSGSEQEIRKFSHHFEEKQKIRVNADGRTGRIENFNAKQHVNVRLDTGHLVEYLPDEISPADWQDSPTAKLQRAIEAGRVSVPDQVTFQIALEKIATGKYAVDPFGETLSDSPHETLRILAEKYDKTSADGGDLAKRAPSKFHIGQAVKAQGRAGIVSELTPGGLIEVKFTTSTSGLYIPANVEAA